MRYCGFNMLDMVSFGWNPLANINERELDFIAKQNLNFLSFPTDYRYWTNDFDYLHPNESAIYISTII